MRVFKSLDNVEIVRRLKDGQVGVLPSDTIYGLMADATNQAAVTGLYKLKSREHKPGTVIAASMEQLVSLGIPRRYLKAVEQFWPGPVSIIVPDEPMLTYLDQGMRSLACRIPKDEVVRKLLEKTGPLVTTSANHPGQAPANTLKEAQKYFGDEVDFYVDGGDLSGHPASTIIRVVDDAVEVVRQGAVTIDEASGEIIT